MQPTPLNPPKYGKFRTAKVVGKPSSPATLAQRLVLAELVGVQAAHTDSLTGLANRYAIRVAVTRALTDAPSKGFSLLLIDLDRFKQINDTYGHLTGDEALLRAVKVFNNCAKKGDMVARIGGDEFLLFVNDESAVTAELLATAILAELALPRECFGTTIALSCSIGIATYPKQGSSLTELVSHADMAMYEAKSNGGGCFRIFNDALQAKATKAAWLNRDLKTAIDAGQLELYYQPKVSLDTKTIECAEALIRWNHPERGLIYPGEFIAFAETSNLIADIGLWALDAAANQAAVWAKRGIKVRIAVNLSAQQLRKPSLISDFKRIVSSNGIEPSMLDLELTESCVVSDGPLAFELISEFRSLGVRIHLDDFGTGFSSLSQLAQMPLDALKIDGSFVKASTTNAKARALIRAITAMGHELDLKVIAECVETQEQSDFLAGIGVDYAQGWLFSKALKITDFDKLLLS